MPDITQAAVLGSLNVRNTFLCSSFEFINSLKDRSNLPTKSEITKSKTAAHNKIIFVNNALFF